MEEGVSRKPVDVSNKIKANCATNFYICAL